MTAPLDTPDTAAQVAREPLRVMYRNWRGDERSRSLIPISVRYGTTQWHPEPTWLLEATDIETAEVREFDLGQMQPVALRAQSDPAATQGLEAGFRDGIEAAVQCINQFHTHAMKLGHFADAGTAEWLGKTIRALSPASPLPADAEGERRGWQPIETAPKTGEARLLACHQGVMTMGFWGKGVSEPEGSESWRDGCRWRPIKPTHWQPLPPPPESSGEQPAAPAAGGA